ncbi:MAG: CobW family GTP-binding protein [Cellulosilyticaceae bacterium]
MELYLITGFLGAGKTTCIQNILKLWHDQKVALIINEFGKQGVDGKLLEGDGIAVEEITNGSIFCTCKLNRLEEVLEETIAKAPDVVLIEASGLSDPTKAYEILGQARFGALDYKGCICIVDAARFEKVIRTATVSRKQVRIANQVIINKTDLVDQEKVDEVKRMIATYNPYVTCEQTCFGQMQAQWVMNMGNKVQHERAYDILTRDLTLQKYSIEISQNCTEQTLRKLLETFIEDTYRIKGFVAVQEEVYLVDCVGDTISIKPYASQECLGNHLVVLAGVGMSLGKSLKRTQAMYPGHLLKIE